MEVCVSIFKQYFQYVFNKKEKREAVSQTGPPPPQKKKQKRRREKKKLRKSECHGGTTGQRRERPGVTGLGE